MSVIPGPARAPGPASALAEEERLDGRAAADEAQFHALVRRLSDQSVAKHYDAYADIPWDDPAYAIDPDDPRWILDETQPLGATAWYRDQDRWRQARVGLFTIAASMKRGLEFENILKRGLLDYAFSRLPNGDPRFRYVYHEVAEETHHGMMFQEFVNRSAMDPAPMPRHMRPGTRFVVGMGHRFPPLFFLFVLGGEDPIDQVQRSVLRSRRDLHPLIETIMRHHVTEEARHISFARHHLKIEVPRLGRVARAYVSVVTPIMLGMMANMMLAPPPGLRTRFGVPRAVRREARTNAVARRRKLDSVAKMRRLAGELGLVTPRTRLLWKAFGLWEDVAPAPT
jgi:hypothetical protein